MGLKIDVTRNGKQYMTRTFGDSDTLISIGRAEDNDISLGGLDPEHGVDHRVSSYHAAIIRRGAGAPDQPEYILRDLSSLNGTIAHGKRILMVPLDDVTEIQIQSFRLEVHVKQAEGQRTYERPAVSRGKATTQAAVSIPDEFKDFADDSPQKKLVGAVARRMLHAASEDALLEWLAHEVLSAMASCQSMFCFDHAGNRMVEFGVGVDIPLPPGSISAAHRGKPTLSEDGFVVVVPVPSGAREFIGYWAIQRDNLKAIRFTAKDMRFLAALVAHALKIFRAQGGIPARPAWFWRIEQDNESVEPLIVTCNARMRKALVEADKFAKTRTEVLILGPTGTGKELFASRIHHRSKRTGKCESINCAAIPADLLESELFGSVKGAYTSATDRVGRIVPADEGTLFLDEIGDFPIVQQPKLLRFLEDGRVYPVGSNKFTQVDVRVVTATLHDIDERVSKKEFREDLFERLSGIVLSLPPLRERPVDIPLLAHYFLDGRAAAEGKAPRSIAYTALKKLLEYHWPGNVRELEKCMGRAYHKGGDELTEADFDLPRPADDSDHATPPGDSLEDYERLGMVNALAKANGNVKQAAGIFNISLAGFYEKMKRYQIPLANQPEPVKVAAGESKSI